MSNQTNYPPRYALRFLTWFCPDALYEGVEGDLLEQFESDCSTMGITKARKAFVWNTLKFFRPEIILRNKFSTDIIQTSMLSNYLKVAKRNIVKRKLYSFINAFGLSIGICFCMLIYLFIRDEQSFDSFHTNKDQIYRIEEKSFDTWQHDAPDPYRRSAWIQTALQPVLKTELPEVKYATRYNPSSTAIFSYEDKVFTEKITYVDADFFHMFSFPLLKGNIDKLFENKSDVVLTESIAMKYFGNDDPIGKTIRIDHNGERSYTVVGIIEAAPAKFKY